MTIKTTIVTIILLTGLTISACGRSSKVMDEATATPVEIVAVSQAIEATPDGQDGSETEPAPTLITMTESSPAPDATESDLMPLEVEAATDCALESDLDLVGYPDIETQMGCPLSEATFHPIAINEFGMGPDYDRFMLWFSDENQIYLLLPDGTWQTHEDTWTEDQPIYTCNPLDGEEASPPLPRRGFGKLWCSDEALQEQMGLIEREERLCQHSVLQQFEAGRLLGCFEDDTIRYFRLLNDQTWD